MNRKIILLLLLTSASIGAEAKSHRYKGHMVQYISGNCRDGRGVAIMSMNSIYKDDLRNQLHYSGTFKDSLMDGEAVAYKTSSDYYVSGEKTRIYIGHFSEGDMDGYMTIWLAKGAGDDMMPDSTETVCFVRYDQGIVAEKIEVEQDGSVVNYFGNKEYVNGRRDDKRKIKDDQLNALASGFIASRKGRFKGGPSATPVIIAVKNVNVVRGRPGRFIDWECLTDRKYFVTATALTKYRQMPFGGSVTYQVYSSDGTLVFDAPVDRYFTPTKPDKYSFQIVFDQNVIGGELVDGVSLELSLRSRGL